MSLVDKSSANTIPVAEIRILLAAMGCSRPFETLLGCLGLGGLWVLGRSQW